MPVEIICEEADKENDFNQVSHAVKYRINNFLEKITGQQKISFFLNERALIAVVYYEE